MAANCICSVHRNSTPTSHAPPTTRLGSLQIPSSSFLKIRDTAKFNPINNGAFTRTIGRRRREGGIVCSILPVDPWAPNIDSQSIASQLFAFSLFPYLGFLYFITKSKSAPKLTVFGFYFLLAFVGATSKFFSLLFNLYFLCFFFVSFVLRAYDFVAIIRTFI